MVNFIVQMEQWEIKDLPCTLSEYRDFCSNYHYYLVVNETTVTSYNRFPNERDAKLYALSHDKKVELLNEDYYQC